jgi:hypothetical protein
MIKPGNLLEIIFLILIAIHGLIHSLGFIKAFGIKEVKELTLSVSKPFGILWLIATILFLLFGVLYFNNSKQAWGFGIIAVVVSQLLIILFWKDAKFGSIPNVIILIVAVVGLGANFLHQQFANRVVQDFADNNPLFTDILTEKDIAHLPVIVQKYLRYTRSVGQPKVQNFRAEFEGGMRSGPEDDYMQVHSVQYNFYQNPSRYFFMTAKKMGLPATGLHLYQNGTATFEVRLLNWFAVVDAKGDKMDQGETVTLLNDMCIMAPATLIDKRLTWEEIDALSVKVIFKNQDIEISAILHFNEKGELINFTSRDRYETDGKEYVNNPWSTPLEAYEEINGYLLTKGGKLIYHRPEGDFVYGELEFNSLYYNLRSMDDYPQ